ncbi:TIGR02099 family protein [Dyella monticola]|uniref:TIGR02099 family protein n=1 Tax=Dyella monticola TaxID=1927958 RepID=A0A370WYM3_9GAMM|nr:YhdP family protein [Dyella monticola]RDS81258.1 TIGR02099 family protein [Dyella monticola]
MRWQAWVHRATRALGWVVGVAVIALALSAGLAQVLLPLLAKHPQWVAQELSTKLQRPVTFTSLQGRWEPSGPRFIMHGVTFAANGNGAPLHVPEVDLKLDFGGWLLPSRHLLNLQASGLELDLTRDVSGHWHINGIGEAGGAERQNISFGHLSVELWLDNLRVDINDQLIDQHYTLLADQLRVTHQGNHIHVGARVHRLGATGVLQAAGRFRDDGASGRFWLATKDADLRGLLTGFDLGGYAVDSGHGSMAVWMDWRDGQIVRDLFQLDLHNMAVTNPAGVKASVTTLSGLAELSRRDAGYTVRWADNDGGAVRVDVRHFGTAQADISAVASTLHIAPLMPWLGLKPGLSPTLAQWLGAGEPHGLIDRAVFHWSAANGLNTLDAVFDDVGITAVGKLPGVDHLHGEARGDAEAVSLELPTQTSTISFPHTFRKPFVMSQLSGTLAAWRGDDATHIGIADMAFEGEGYGGNAQGDIALPSEGGRPFLDVYVALTHADITAAKLFWPIDSMPPSAINWLDNTLVSGHVDDASVLVRGSLANWPFHHNEGRFEARADISDLALAYGKTWPVAEHIQATANFIDGGMLVEASTGDSLGVKVNHAVAVIPELGHTTLDLNVSGNGNASDLLNFVANSPIADKQANVLAKLKLGGTGSFDFHLSLPTHEMRDFLLDGNAQLKDVDLSAPDWNVQLDKLNGPATFDAHGFHAGPLAGGFRGEPSQVDLAIAGATGDPNIVVAAKVDGTYAVQELLQGYPQLKWLGDVASGRSPFTIGYQIAHAGEGVPDVQTLSIDSPLSGVALNFPVPVNKPAESTMPLHVTLGIPTDGADMQVALGSVVRGRLRLPAGASSPLAATFAFGDQMPDSLPAKGMRIRGDAPELNVTGWVKQSIGGATGNNGMSLETIDVTTEHAEMFGRDFAQMHITAQPAASTLELDVDSALAAGHFSVPTEELAKRGITARLQRMYWPKPPTAQPKKPGEVPVPAEVTDPANTGIDPAGMPPLHIWVHDLRLDQAKLGEARLETWPTSEGMHIDQLSTQSKSVEISGSGDWKGTPTHSSTHLRVNFSAGNLGDMLNAFGYADVFEGGKTHDELDATWPGGPWAFELDNMDGTLSVNVSNGSIPKVAPGVGRFFGLASIAELPRRLSFNFKDVFGKGFAFDSIAGDFKLSNGNAYTDNLKVHSPAAEISVIGRTGLRTKDYDQHMTMIPHIGNSLPVVGAVVGGPIGIAAGLAVQSVLGKGLNRVAIQRYRITGSWDKPVFTSVGASAQSAPASGSSAPAPASSSAH